MLALASDEGTAAPDSSAGEALDASARKAYRRRLAELDEQLIAAEDAGHAAAATRLEREKSALARELARASGSRRTRASEPDRQRSVLA